FLRRVVPGASEQSYGVQVARMAGLPADVTERAATLLRERPASAIASVAEQPTAYASAPPASPERELALALASVNLVDVTPLEALNLLFSLQQRALAWLGVGSPHAVDERGQP
ncbi:MAG: hypothetical protein KGO05_09690, partial [Chloroflexota bacterium]|nr:hypothetical protein [Chloroflexota bacterium]